MRAVPGSRATCSPRTKVAAARCVNPCLANLLGKGFWLFSVQHRCPWWWWNSNTPGGSHHPCGLYSTEARDSETHPRHHGPPVQRPPRLKTPMRPSSGRTDGKLMSHPAVWMGQEWMEIDPCRLPVHCPDLDSVLMSIGTEATRSS